MTVGKEPSLTPIYTVPHVEAQLIKSRLESMGIPVVLRYESVGLVWGLTSDGLGETTVLVPADLAEDARLILESGGSEEE